MDIFSVMFIIFVLIVIWFFFLKDNKHKIYLQNIPGPKTFLFFGNALELRGGSKAIISVISRWFKQYGDTIIVYESPLTIDVITIDYNITKLIYRSSIHIDKSYQYSFSNGWLGEGLLTSTGETWRTHRKSISPAFHFSTIQKNVSIFDRASDKLIKKLEEHAGKNSIEISEIISLYTLDIICEAAMGVKITEANESYVTYIKCIKTMCYLIVGRLTSVLHPIFYPLTWRYFKEKTALKYIHKFVDDIITKKTTELKAQKTQNQNEDFEQKKPLVFLDLLLRTSMDGRKLNKIELRDEVNTFMFAGHDTTASAISFCLYLLSKHPQVQERVYEEQRSMFGSNLKHVSPSYAELNNMKYLELVIKESLRLYPPVPFIGRKLTTDLEYNGTLYPKGLNVVLFIYSMHRNKKYFPDPEEFIPERFEKVDGKLTYAYTPFAAGSRHCIGQKFAMLEILSTVSKIVRHFILNPSIPEHHLKLAAELVLISQNGIRLALSKRE